MSVFLRREGYLPYFLKCDINAVNVVILQNILNGNVSNFLIKGHPRTGVPTMSIERQLTKFQFVQQAKGALLYAFGGSA